MPASLTTLHSPQNQAFRNLLRDVREGKGITQVELAARLDKPQSFISKYETGERRLDVLEFAEICEALDLDAAEVLRDFLKTSGGSQRKRPRR